MSGGQSGQQLRNPDLKALGTKSIGKRKASCFFQDFQTAHSFSWGLGGFEVKLLASKKELNVSSSRLLLLEVHKEGKIACIGMESLFLALQPEGRLARLWQGATRY